jgi:hypothetical protein
VEAQCFHNALLSILRLSAAQHVSCLLLLKC